nr:chitinase [Salmonella enterica]
MKISYPIRDKDGKEFRSLDEIMQRIDAEAHGTWLLGGNGLWHGAVHISEVSNPRSALTPDTLSTGEPVPLQFMADGTIAAYRINNDYLKGPYKGQELRYSSTFVLVKSQCQPDPQKEKSWLEFYSLYMHLAPVKDYPASLCYKVRAGHSGILLRKYTSGQNGLPETQESGDPVIYQAPPKTRNSLKAGDRFASSCTGRFYVTRGEQSTLMTFGLVRLLNEETAGNEQYWVTLDPTLMEPDGEIQALMPAWMQKAKAKGVFDQVQAGGETEEWQVSAGTPVGFMGCEEYPGKEGSQTEREWFVHLEVLSADPRMPAFLGNPEGIKGEKRTVRAPKGKILYTRQATAEQATFSATSATLEAQYMLPRITTTPVMDASKQWWFNITGSGWLPEKDVEEAGQYDLLKQGFQPLEENSGGDMVSSPYEGWVPEAFDSVSRAAAQGDEWYEQVPPFYRELMVRMDSDQDGKVTEEEIRQALVVRDPLVRHVVNRLVIKHHSEWCVGRSTGRWEGFYKDLDTEETAYCEKWQSDLEWMSGVPPFNTDEPVWHFHPVVFLSTLFDDDQLITYEQLKLMLPSDQEAKASIYLKPLNEAMRLFEINTPLRKSHFMAQILHETGFFMYTEEIASGNAYEGRSDLGNNHAGDGPLFKGRGLLQITGRSNYTKCQEYLRTKLNDRMFDITSSMSKAKQLSENPRYAALASGYFWKYIKLKLNTTADKDDVYWVSVYVNGWAVQEHPYYPDKAREPNHMDDRVNKLSIVKNAFGLE